MRTDPLHLSFWLGALACLANHEELLFDDELVSLTTECLRRCPPMARA